MTIRRAAGSIAVGLVALFASASSFAQSGNFALRGTVVDIGGARQAQIEVTAAVGPSVIARTTTDGNGRYSFAFPAKGGSPLTILFNGSQFRPGVIQYVAAESNDNVLTTVLLRPGQISSELTTEVEKAVTRYLELIRKSSDPRVGGQH